MDAPKVSIVLPFRNASQYLSECVNSIQDQTIDSWELIAVNDCSSDQSLQILNSFAKKDFRIKVYHSPGIGIVSALNHGLKYSTAQIIARMDADDLMEPKRLELQLGYLQQNQNLGLVSSLTEHFPKSDINRGYDLYVDWTNNILTYDEHFDHRFIDSTFAHPSATFRKCLIKKFGSYRDGDFPEDFELWLRWLQLGVKMEKIPQVLLKWRDHPKRASRSDSRYRISAFQKIKAKYFHLWFLQKTSLHNRQIFCWGAGRVARKFSDYLIKKGIPISVFIDLDPNKIGTMIKGLPIIGIEDLPPPTTCFVLILVGVRGARKEVSDFLSGKGYILGKDFIALS